MFVEYPFANAKTDTHTTHEQTHNMRYILFYNCQMIRNRIREICLFLYAIFRLARIMVDNGWNEMEDLLMVELLHPKCQCEFEIHVEGERVPSTNIRNNLMSPETAPTRCGHNRNVMYSKYWAVKCDVSLNLSERMRVRLFGSMLRRDWRTGHKLCFKSVSLALH